MAKQRDDDLGKRKKPRPEDLEDLEIASEEELEAAEPVEDVIEAAEVVEAAEASPAPKTPVGPKTPPRGTPPRAGGKTAQPTQLARGEPHEIPGKDAPKQPSVPDLSLDKPEAEEVFEAEEVLDVA